MAHTVKAVADLAGISVRTLHHFDQIGLLKPIESTPAGYRLYTERDLERLQQVLFFRELGLGLREIKAIIDSPGFDRRQALLSHKQLLLERRDRLTRLIAAVDQTIKAMERGIHMDEKVMFDGFDQTKYEEEARQRWGQTEAYKESLKRTQRYTKEDWAAIQRESGQIEQGIAALMDRSPSDPAVQAYISRHYNQINDRFYACPLEMYRGLGDMYVQDDRFAAHFEAIKPGMARFMQAAINAYCDEAASKKGQP